jgi:prefoldin subunit 5
MDAETEAAIERLTARLEAIEARLERGRKEFERIRWLIEGYAIAQDKHNEEVWQLKHRRNLHLQALYEELNAVTAQIDVLVMDLAALTKRMDEYAQQPRPARNHSRRRADTDH